MLFVAAVVLAAVACTAAAAEAPAPGQGYLYVGNTGERTITVIDATNGSVVKSIDNGYQVTGMAADATGYFVYLACYDDVRILDTRDDSIRAAGLGQGPRAIAVCPDGSGYYVLYGSYIDLARVGSGDVSKKIDLPRSKDIMAISQDGKTACLASDTFEVVGLYSLPSGEPASPEIDFGAAVDCTFSPDGEFAYVSLKGQNKVIALKVHDYFIKYDVPLNSKAAGLAVSPDGSTLYAVEPSNNKVIAINTTNRSVAGSIDVGGSPQRILFSPDGKFAYVSNAGSNTVSVIDTGGLPNNTGSVVKTINVGKRPVYLAMAIASRPAVPTPMSTPSPTPTQAPSPSPTPTPSATATTAPTTEPIVTPTPTPWPDTMAVMACLAITGLYIKEKEKR